MNTRQLNHLFDDRAARLDRVDARTSTLARQLAGLLAEAPLSARADDAHQIGERLRAARVRAVAQRKREFAEGLSVAPAATSGLLVWIKGILGVQTSVVAQGLGSFGAPRRSAKSDNDGLGWASGIASALPAIALVAALVVIHDASTEARVAELAALDAELLADDLPPSAYADPGFAQFLKQQR